MNDGFSINRKELIMPNNTESKINEFINNLIKECDGIVINYEYDKEDDFYLILHNKPYYDFPELQEIVGRNIRECFLENDIFNISVSYKLL